MPEPVDNDPYLPNGWLWCMMNTMIHQFNVLGSPLQPCSFNPLTGFMRDGYCNCIPNDVGQHTVCCVVTDAFLQFSMSVGNDLSTPQPQIKFPGLRPGDQWCLCANRWLQSHASHCAPSIVLESTHESVLKLVPLDVLKQFEL